MATPVTNVDEFGKALGSPSNPVQTQDRGTVYRRAGALAASGGDGLLISSVTTAGPITVTFSGGGSGVINVPLGSSILALSASAVNMGSTGGSAQSLFFT